jgi:hypothetical protein
MPSSNPLNPMNLVDISVELVDTMDDQRIHPEDYTMFDIVHHVEYEHQDDLNDVCIDI